MAVKETGDRIVIQTVIVYDLPLTSSFPDERGQGHTRRDWQGRCKSSSVPWATTSGVVVQGYGRCPVEGCLKTTVGYPPRGSGHHRRVRRSGSWPGSNTEEVPDLELGSHFFLWRRFKKDRIPGDGVRITLTDEGYRREGIRNHKRNEESWIRV